MLPAGAGSFPSVYPRGSHLQGPVTSHYALVSCVAPPSLPTTFGQLADTMGKMGATNTRQSPRPSPAAGDCPPC
jgi:hypothetical protein